MGVKPFDVSAFTKANIIDPKNVSYQDSVDIINDELHKARKSFIKIGWYLKHINEANMYKEDGYANINDFAYDKFKISQSTTTRLIGLCCQFSVGHDSPELDEKYLDYNISQLFEMLPMLQEQREKITPDMTIRQIRDMKNEDKNEDKELSVDENDSEKDIPGQTSIEKDFPEYMPDDISAEPAPEKENEYATSHKQEVDEKEIIDGEYREVEDTRLDETEVSAYGHPKTEYPEGSLIATEGCGHKQYCFDCAQDCAIRQKSRYCCEAPLGNSFDCTTMNVLESLRNDIGNECQFINLDLAEHTANGTSNPCCKKCQKNDCGYRCKRSVEVLPENIETGQLELPQFKNNAQRKAWIENVEAWGLWYEDSNIQARYYKYDFVDGSRLIAVKYRYTCPPWIEDKELNGEYKDTYYHMIYSDEYIKYHSYSYDKYYTNSTVSITSITLSI